MVWKSIGEADTVGMKVAEVEEDSIGIVVVGRILEE